MHQGHVDVCTVFERVQTGLEHVVLLAVELLVQVLGGVEPILSGQRYRREAGGGKDGQHQLPAT